MPCTTSAMSPCAKTPSGCPPGPPSRSSPPSATPPFAVLRLADSPAQPGPAVGRAQPSPAHGSPRPDPTSMTTAHSCGAGGQRSHATGGLPACPLQHHGRWRPERQRFLRAGHRFPAYGGLVSLEWEQVVVDARDPAALGRWWADALSWVIVNDSAEEFEI